MIKRTSHACYHVHIIKADKTRTSNSQDIPSRLYVSSLIFNNPWRLGIDAYPIYSIHPNHDNVTYCICLYKGPWLLTFFIWVTFYCPTVAEVISVITASTYRENGQPPKYSIRWWYQSDTWLCLLFRPTSQYKTWCSDNNLSGLTDYFPHSSFFFWCNYM